MIKVTLNQQPLQVSADALLPQVIEQHYGDSQGIAVVLNGQIVPKAEWALTSVPANAEIKIFRAIAGG